MCLEADASTLVQCLWAAGVHTLLPGRGCQRRRSSAAAAGDACVCVRGEARCASVLLLNSGLGLFSLPDQKFIVALNQTAHKAFFNMCKYLYFAVGLLYIEQPLP